MGSALKFIQSAADPIGDIVAHVAGPNSFIGKDSPSWAKYINPEIAQVEAEHQAEFTAPSGVLSSGTASGQAATLAGAQSGYYTPSHGVYVGAGQAGTPGAASGTAVFNPGTGGLNGLPAQNGAPGGTNFFAGGAPAVAAATPQSYVQAAGRAQAAGPQSQQAGWG